MKTVHVDKFNKTFKCEICSFASHAQRYLSEHMTTCHSNSSDKNNQENKQDTNQQYENKTQEYTCEICKQKFASSGNFVTHYKKVHNEIPPDFKDQKQYLCHQCPDVFLTKPLLYYHTSRYHSDQPTKEYVCKDCDVTYTGKLKYVRHCRKVHKIIPPEFKNQKQYLCDECPDVFMSNTGLHLHKVSMHCQESVKKKAKKLLAKKEKKSCPHCTKTFNCLSNFREHVKVVHRKSTPFECDQCPRKFGYVTKLKNHKRQVHTRVNCDICGQEICNTFMVKRHKASVHGIIPSGVFQCKQCPLFFEWEKNLQYHIEKKHK